MIANRDRLNLGDREIDCCECESCCPGLAGVSVLLRLNPNFCLSNLSHNSRIGKLIRIQPNLQSISFSSSAGGVSVAAVVLIISRKAEYRACDCTILSAGQIFRSCLPLIFKRFVDEDIGPRPTEQSIQPTSAIERISACTPIDGVIARAPIDDIITGTENDLIVTQRSHSGSGHRL